MVADGALGDYLWVVLEIGAHVHGSFDQFYVGVRIYDKIESLGVGLKDGILFCFFFATGFVEPFFVFALDNSFLNRFPLVLNLLILPRSR